MILWVSGVTEISIKSARTVENAGPVPTNKVENAGKHLLNCIFALVNEPGSLTRPGGRKFLCAVWLFTITFDYPNIQ